MLIVTLNMSMISHDIIKYFVIRHFRGTRSSVEMLKGSMVRERLGSPVLRGESLLCPYLLLY